jgi:hypothetical protein
MRISRKTASVPARATAMRQPTHDDLPPPDHLLAVDTQVLPPARLRHALRAARDDQAPGNERAGVAGP